MLHDKSAYVYFFPTITPVNACLMFTSHFSWFIYNATNIDTFIRLEPRRVYRNQGVKRWLGMLDMLKHAL